MLELGVKFLISYLLGSLMGSLLVGYLRGGVDIRDMGSGNAGGTNALRTQGFWFALGVVIVDVGKGALAAGVVPGLDIPFVGFAPAVSREAGRWKPRWRIIPKPSTCGRSRGASIRTETPPRRSSATSGPSITASAAARGPRRWSGRCSCWPRHCSGRCCSSSPSYWS